MGTAGANRLAIISRRESAPAAWMLIQDLAIAGRRLLSTETESRRRGFDL
jgi:hypothetical protein